MIENNCILREIFIERKIKFYYNLLKKEDLLEEWPVDTLLRLLSNQSKSFLIDDLFKQVKILFYNHKRLISIQIIRLTQLIFNSVYVMHLLTCLLKI
jgi:hypothetical protein